MIFDLYMEGHGVISIIRELAKQGIESPHGCERWSNRAIETMLDNEKYMGEVIVGKTYTKCDYINSRRAVNRGESLQYKMDNVHEGIISAEQFEAVREERKRRSNIEVVDGVRKRKGTHYSCKIGTRNDDEL